MRRSAPRCATEAQDYSFHPGCQELARSPALLGTPAATRSRSPEELQGTLPSGLGHALEIKA
jgi:hypothetical protein